MCPPVFIEVSRRVFVAARPREEAVVPPGTTSVRISVEAVRHCCVRGGVALIFWTICATVRPAHGPGAPLPMQRATVPATCGEAMLVPEMVLSPLVQPRGEHADARAGDRGL